MKRFLVPLLCLCAMAGCKKAQSSDVQPRVQRTASRANLDDDDAPRAPAPAQKLEITEDVVKRYLAYWEKSITVSRTALEDIARVRLEAERKGGITGATHALGHNEAIEERAEAQHDALLTQYGFTEEQVHELSELMLSVAMMRQMTSDSGAGTTFVDMKKQLDTLPADKRAAARAQIEALEQQLNDHQTMKEARQKFGDAAVEAALKHADEIVALNQKTFGTLK